jgi:hypothetical protein
MQPAGDLLQRKCKENQGKILAFPWIPLVEFGLFKGLSAKNKKIPDPSNSRPRLRFSGVSMRKNLLLNSPSLTNPSPIV